ncbi:MAG: cytochrome c [Alphaproteobacteria bacterium]|nr:cytochrome c [Alphaproteobacteria bacterium]
MEKLLIAAVLGAVIGLAPAPSALAHELGTYESPIVEQRVKRFKQSGGDIQAIFKKHLGAGNFAAIQDAAARMAAWGDDMPGAFPAGSNSIGADKAVWKNFSDFEAKAQVFVDAARALKAAAASGDAGATKKAAQMVGASCKSCHESYRIKH